MTELARTHDGVKNYTVAVKEQNEDVLFLRKIVEGGADRSYGIHVARLAGLPAAVLSRAREVLAQLEQASASVQSSQQTSSSDSSPNPTLPLPHPIIEEVRQIDLFSMTPLEAMNRLAEMQRRLDDETKK
jgi:DNA mismatch repair protein MutS